MTWEGARGTGGWRYALAAIAVAAGGAAYARLVRPRLTNFGATPAEVARSMPLDGEVAGAHVVTNRATTIEAPPEAVWPWLAQMGELPRGGFYSFLAVERLLGMKVRNADRILPEHQDPRPGQALDRGGNMLVKAVLPGECLVLGPPPGGPVSTTWALAVYPESPGRSRFVSRCRIRYNRWTPMAVVFFVVLEWGQLLMEWKMLSEVKKRAQRLHRASA
jgi:hypothetical protein